MFACQISHKWMRCDIYVNRNEDFGKLCDFQLICQFLKLSTSIWLKITFEDQWTHKFHERLQSFINVCNLLLQHVHFKTSLDVCGLETMKEAPVALLMAASSPSKVPFCTFLSLHLLTTILTSCDYQGVQFLPVYKLAPVSRRISKGFFLKCK